MLRSWSTTLLFLPFLFAQCFACAQSSDPGHTQISPSASSKPSKASQADQATVPNAAPIPSNAPRISKQSRYQIIRDFETQLVYARTAFPMGTKGLQLKQGVITPNGEELRQALTL